MQCIFIIILNKKKRRRNQQQQQRTKCASEFHVRLGNPFDIVTDILKPAKL